MTEDHRAPPNPATKVAARAARRDRLAAELRANLRRRKAQDRARATSDADPADVTDRAPPAGTDPDG
jgi:hypothetical protein